MVWQRVKRSTRRALLFLSILGPGLITASADNDAGGIATYSMAGSRYGYSFLWVILWVTVGEIIIQEIAARMGSATGKGLTDLIREWFGLRLTMLVMMGLVIANLGTTIAQFAGIASSAELFGLSRYIIVPIAALGIYVLVTSGTYRVVEKVLLVLSLYAVAYIASAFMAKPPWGEVLKQAIVPTFHLETTYLLALLATVGTTITPWGAVYMQASVADKRATMADIKSTRADVIFGAAAGNVVSAFIIICTAATLFVRGIRVESAEQAALALAPVAGRWAETLFGAGLMGASILAASVLPLATTYAVCEVFGWERGLDRKPREAPMFYGLFGGLILLSTLIVLIPSLPLFPLMWLSQVANAVLLPLVMALMLRLVNNKAIMKRHTNSKLVNVIAIAFIVLVSLATLALFVSS
jgi:NRAMP (natural resistance-associated macrophage protein)-like metal ion transporter